MKKILLASLLVISVQTFAGGIRPLRSFPEEAVFMRAQALPMLILFTQEDCHFCETIKTEFLQPMQLSGDYESRVLLRQLPMDSYADMITPSGESMAASEFSHSYGVDFSPTVLLLDHAGTSLTEPLIGFSGTHYYGFYLEKRITAAVDQVKNR